MNFVRELFDYETFMPHGQCFLWNPEVLWLHVISDVIIFIAYFSIPVSILFVIRKRYEIPFKWIFVMFSAFILLCGATHIIAVMTLWIPMYRFEGVIKALTAGVSIGTAILFLQALPQVMDIMDKQLDKKNPPPPKNKNS